MRKLTKGQKTAITTHLIKGGIMTPEGKILERDPKKVVLFIKKILEEGKYGMSLKQAIKAVHHFQEYRGDRLISWNLMSVEG